MRNAFKTDNVQVIIYDYVNEVIEELFSLNLGGGILPSLLVFP